MKKYLNCIMALLLSVGFVVAVVGEPLVAMAKVKMPDKSQILVERISDYVALEIVESPKNTWTKVKMDNKTYFCALALILCGYEDKYSFDSEKQVHNLCYKYFGKTGYKDVTDSKYFCSQDGKIIVNGGDWGASWPECKITKKEKVKSGVYDVYITNYLRSEPEILEPGEPEVKKVGESVVRIKKNKKSSFGYVVIGIKYKTTDDRFLKND